MLLLFCSSFFRWCLEDAMTRTNTNNECNAITEWQIHPNAQNHMRRSYDSINFFSHRIRLSKGNPLLKSIEVREEEELITRVEWTLHRRVFWIETKDNSNICWSKKSYITRKLETVSNKKEYSLKDNLCKVLQKKDIVHKINYRCERREGKFSKKTRTGNSLYNPLQFLLLVAESATIHRV